MALYSYQLTQRNKKLYLSNDEKIKHYRTKFCEECKCQLDGNRVAHHDHISGKYISTLCYNCNLKLQYRKFVPVYIHNLKGYDSHFY